MAWLNLFFDRRLLSEDKLLVPAEPEISKVEEPCSISVPEFDSKKILLLESLSLARFDDEQAVALLRAVVRKAKQLQDVHVEGVAKMFTVWNNQDCPLADDFPTEQSPPEKVLSNAARVLDQYFVSPPPGNIALGESCLTANKTRLDYLQSTCRDSSKVELGRIF
ncbi:unnamed protein product [Heligmosomoides polygyrus]|uniref:Glutamyl-tRNA(Gln) amidotransferase subunit C, mitochondrial n=1 Tax=Heligmosomoides polygyrus TaxID=6339 RepID=A0A183FSJ9_HELPZ|nr:unnamed protein product [Heligmosomoides polygyrus]